MGALRRLVLTAALVVVPLQGALSQQPLQMDLDHSSFAFDDASSLVEMYLAFEASTLGFTADSTGFAAMLPVDVSVFRASDAVLEGTPGDAVWADTLDLVFVLADTSGIRPGQQFVHQVRATVPPGEYEIVVDVPEDASVGRQSLSLRREILVPDFSDPGMVGLSDVTLASEIRRALDRDEAFYKSGLVVRPNANQLFGLGLPHVYYYTEAYNLEALAPAETGYTVMAYISEVNLPQPLPDHQRRVTRPLRSPDVLVGSFDVSGLPSGSYFLRIALLNSGNESLVERSRRFFVYNPGVERAQVAGVEEDFETSQYATMTAEQVEQAGRHIDIIASTTERRRLDGIEDLDERRRFLMEFWRKRDPVPSTSVNEYQEEFYQRLQYANDRYTSTFTEGWETDRGRTIIKYGPPSRVDPHLYDRGFAPYEVWEYNNIPGEGQAVFVFADQGNFGLFELIHSTVTGERRLANWMEELRR
jgi:GWxTD domain-containing protein